MWNNFIGLLICLKRLNEIASLTKKEELAFD